MYIFQNTKLTRGRKMDFFVENAAKQQTEMKVEGIDESVSAVRLRWAYGMIGHSPPPLWFDPILPPWLSMIAPNLAPPASTSPFWAERRSHSPSKRLTSYLNSLENIQSVGLLPCQGGGTTGGWTFCTNSIYIRLELYTIMPGPLWRWTWPPTRRHSWS